MIYFHAVLVAHSSFQVFLFSNYCFSYTQLYSFKYRKELNSSFWHIDWTQTSTNTRVKVHIAVMKIFKKF